VDLEVISLNSAGIVLEVLGGQVGFGQLSKHTTGNVDDGSLPYGAVVGAAMVFSNGE
jgi:hypothetical protein